MTVSNPNADKVSVITTVKNDADGVHTVLYSLARQTRPPDEIVVVDGGSTDGTWQMLETLALARDNLKVLSAPGANIAAGRNIATKAATGEIIASTDSGCRAAPDWLEKLVAPFDEDANVEFVAGLYHVEPQTLFEQVVGLATMRGQLEAVREETFNPSGRSMAYRKSAWLRAGGWPDWLRYSEDTLFDHKMRRLGVSWRLAGDALVHWRPRSTIRGLVKQFYFYGTGRGHTQIGAADFAYNARNLAFLLLGCCLSFVSMWALPWTVAAFLYFYVWTFHGKAVRIALRTGRMLAYPMTLLVMWIVMFSNLTGYLVGSWQRWRSRGQMGEAMMTYLAASP